MVPAELNEPHETPHNEHVEDASSKRWESVPILVETFLDFKVYLRASIDEIGSCHTAYIRRVHPHGK